MLIFRLITLWNELDLIKCPTSGLNKNNLVRKYNWLTSYIGCFKTQRVIRLSMFFSIYLSGYLDSVLIWYLRVIRLGQIHSPFQDPRTLILFQDFKSNKLPILTHMLVYHCHKPVLWSKWPLASSLLQAIKTCPQACPPGYLMHFS